MNLRVWVAMLLLPAAASSAFASEPVTFRSSETVALGQPLSLAGTLYKPEGAGPFPAAVLLHGCGGMTARQKTWGRDLASWGYAAILVDSFGPRGIKSVCQDSSLNRAYATRRVLDAYDAKAYLSGLPFVDRSRIAVLGWSHGGGVVLNAVRAKKDDPFQAAVSFYPYCDTLLTDLNAPLLILIGELDTWSPAGHCKEKIPAEKAKHEIEIKIYPGAYHGFDGKVDTTVMGSRGVHRLLYDPAAAEDSKVRVREFLGKHLK